MKKTFAVSLAFKIGDKRGLISKQIEAHSNNEALGLFIREQWEKHEPISIKGFTVLEIQQPVTEPLEQDPKNIKNLIREKMDEVKKPEPEKQQPKYKEGQTVWVIRNGLAIKKSKIETVFKDVEPSYGILDSLYMEDEVYSSEPKAYVALKELNKSKTL